MRTDRDTLVSGLDKLFKPLTTQSGARFELKLPCVLAVRNFDVHRVIKRLAQALEVKTKFWQENSNQPHFIVNYYTVLYDGRITGVEIGRLIDEFNRPDEVHHRRYLSH